MVESAPVLEQAIRGRGIIHGNYTKEDVDKLKLLKKWERELENRSEPLLKLVEQLHGYLSTDIVKATAFLTEMIKTLQAYAEVQVRAPAPTTVPAVVMPLTATVNVVPLPKTRAEVAPAVPLSMTSPESKLRTGSLKTTSNRICDVLVESAWLAA